MSDAKPTPELPLERVTDPIKDNPREAWGAVILGVGFYLFAKPDIPTTAILVAVFAPISAGVGYITTKYVIEWLWSPSWRYVLDLDSREDDIALWRLTPAKFARLETLSGDMKKWTGKHPLYTAKGYDPEINLAEGTWAGSVSDIDLLRERNRIDEIREDLEGQAQEGLAMRLRASAAVRQAVTKILDGKLAALEGATIDMDNELETAINEAVRENNVDVDVDPDPEDETGDTWEPVPEREKATEAEQ